MRKLLRNKYLLLISRSILAVVFIFAAAEKISDSAAFAEAIYNYRIFPEAVINLFAVIIPWLELLAGILLLFNYFPRENALILNTLLMLFVILVGIAMARGLNINCGCFGTTSGSKVGWQKIGENLFLMLIGMHVILFPGTVRSERNSA